VIARLRNDRGLRGAAWGMLAHFARDVGVGTGVPLLWPVTRRSFRVPYPVYAAGCVVLALRAVLLANLQNRAERANLGAGL
jgi:hypothetical protein